MYNYYIQFFYVPPLNPNDLSEESIQEEMLTNHASKFALQVADMMMNELSNQWFNVSGKGESITAQKHALIYFAWKSDSNDNYFKNVPLEMVVNIFTWVKFLSNPFRTYQEQLGAKDIRLGSVLKIVREAVRFSRKAQKEMNYYETKDKN